MILPSTFRCADLFCSAGGSAIGLYRAGFEVEGWDIKPQKNFPFCFHLGNALEADLDGFDFVWASPPCQVHSATKSLHKSRIHPDLIPATRDKLKAWGGLWIIENVVGAPLINPIMLCGTMFGLKTKSGAQLRRHRLFETSLDCLILVSPCNHGSGSVIGVYGGGQHPQRRVPDTSGVYWHSGGTSKRDYLDFTCFNEQARREAMGIDWMTQSELSQAIPPAYSEFLGRHIIAQLTRLSTARPEPSIPAAVPDASSAPPSAHSTEA